MAEIVESSSKWWILIVLVIILILGSILYYMLIDIKVKYTNNKECAGINCSIQQIIDICIDKNCSNIIAAKEPTNSPEYVETFNVSFTCNIGDGLCRQEITYFEYRAYGTLYNCFTTRQGSISCMHQSIPASNLIKEKP